MDDPPSFCREVGIDGREVHVAAGVDSVRLQGYCRRLDRLWAAVTSNERLLQFKVANVEWIAKLPAA